VPDPRRPRPAAAARRRTPGSCSPRFFAAGAAKRAAAEAGSTRAVTEREADDLVRDADRFLAVVEQALGLTPHVGSPQLCVVAEPVRRSPAARAG
jgi:hypothetical protein